MCGNAPGQIPSLSDFSINDYSTVDDIIDTIESLPEDKQHKFILYVKEMKIKNPKFNKYTIFWTDIIKYWIKKQQGITSIDELKNHIKRTHTPIEMGD